MNEPAGLAAAAQNRTEFGAGRTTSIPTGALLAKGDRLGTDMCLTLSRAGWESSRDMPKKSHFSGFVARWRDRVN